MLDHVALQVADVDASVRFYLTVFAAVGLREAIRHQDDGGGPVVGLCGTDGMPRLWIEARQEQGQQGAHLAFIAPNREAVHAVHDAAVEAGAEVLHDAGEWPEYHPGYYAVYIRDPDGNNVEAVTHG